MSMTSEQCSDIVFSYVVKFLKKESTFMSGLYSLVNGVSDFCDEMDSNQAVICSLIL